jgi:Lrp/AsnC family transcriptional regulator, leucine-responsive regulatory protein
MIKLDIKDRKILYELDSDSRQSANQIGRKAGLSRSVVNYRISRLKEQEIIRNYYTLIDPMSLGFIPIRIHIKFQYTTSEIVNDIIEYFRKNKFSTLVGLADGFFNLSVVIEVKDIHDFYDSWQDAKKKFGYYFGHYTFSFFVNEMRFKSSFLLLNNIKKSDRDRYTFIGKRKISDIDQLDMNIIYSIASNATIPLIDIGKRLDLTSVAIKYRIKKLIEKGVILGFKADIDLSKIGYQKFKVYLKLRDYNIRSKIINYIKFNQYLLNIDTNSGESDIELEFVVVSNNQIHEIVNDLIDKFPNEIKNYDLVSNIKLYKYVYFPEH